ncbi:PREDICTED: transmembrane and immunoglobulin domain-containing protein 2-like, partial [Lipotes vexillifer]|uniref:transmembrane and immunoglobulin domain-containing protein 2-like n=1 Tax=Lipotes vexillifer TaxID=118797 RepID=UPI000441D269
MGKPTTASPGLSFTLLVTGAVAVAAFTLGTWIWVCHHCWNRDTGNPLYSNALYQPCRAPRKSEWPLAPKSSSSPRPIHPISAVGVPPGPGSSGKPRPRGFLEVGRQIRTWRDPERTPQQL